MTNIPNQTSIEDLTSHAQEACASAIKQTDQVLETGKGIVRANPIPLILGAVGIGFLVALLLPKPERSRRERYLDDPLEELKELLRATGRRVGHSADETRDLTSTAVENGLKKLKSILPSF